MNTDLHMHVAVRLLIDTIVLRRIEHRPSMARSSISARRPVTGVKLDII